MQVVVQPDDVPVVSHPRDHEEIGVEEEDEREDRGAQVIGKALHTGLDWVGAGDGRRRVGGQAYRGSVVGQDAEVEDEEVRCDEREDQACVGAELYDDRRRQRGHDDVVGRGGHAHAQDEAGHGGEEEHEPHVAHGDGVDEGDEPPHQAGYGHHADDDSGRGRGDADGDHVARAHDESVPDVQDALPGRLGQEAGHVGVRRQRAGAAVGQHGQVGDDRTLDEHDDRQAFDGQQGRRHGRSAQDHEKVDEHGQGENEVAAAHQGVAEARELVPRDGLDAHLHGLDVYDPEQRQV